MKCNGDCFNCVYEDCILDDDECYEEPNYYREMDNYANGRNNLKKEYKRLNNIVNYYRSIKYYRAYNRGMYYIHKDTYRKYYNKNRKLIKTKQGIYYRKLKKRNFIDWYNKYLEFDGKPLIDNPYKKMSVEERRDKWEKEYENFKKRNGIRTYKRKTNEQLFDNLERALIKKANEQYQKQIIHSFFIKKRKK